MTEQPDEFTLDPESEAQITEARAAVERGEVPDRFDLSHRAMLMRSMIRRQDAEKAQGEPPNK